MQVKNLLFEPYPLFNDSKNWVILSAIACLFVPSFLIFFKPFGINETVSIFYLIGYGVISFLVILLIAVYVPRRLSNIFIEEKWTIGRQIIWLFCILSSIAVLNYFYFNWYFNYPLRLKGFVQSFIWVFSLGIFLITVVTFLDYMRRLKEYTLTSKKMNQSVVNVESIAPKEVILTDDSNKEQVKVHSSNLIYVKADDNYVEVYHLHNNQLKKSVLRNTLKNIETEAGFILKRCHRTYLVNIDHVVKVSGNAQGFRLHLNHSTESVPVSRDKSKEIKQLFYQSSFI